MRPLAAGLLLAFVVSPAVAADTDEDKAKAAAVAFMKAVKAKDVDAMVKVSGMPFMGPPPKPNSRKPGSIDGATELKKHFADVLTRFEKRLDTFPTDPTRAFTLAEFLKEAKGDAEMVAAVEGFVGKSGYVVLFGEKGKGVHAVLVRIKDGTASVVGLSK